MRAAVALLLSLFSLDAAVVSMTSFETGDTYEVTASGTNSVTSSVVRTGGYSGRVNPTTTGTGIFQLNKVAAATGAHDSNFNCADCYVRFPFYYLTKPAANSEEIFVARATTSAAYKLSVRINSTGTLGLYSSGGTTLIGNGSTVLNSGTWYWLGIRVGTGASAAYELRIDGVTELSGTADQGTENTNTIRLGKATNRNGQSVDFYYDDVVVDDAAFPGDGKQAVLKPNASGTYSTWTATGAATDWEATRVTPTSPTEYILSTGTVGNATTVNFDSSSTAGITGSVTIKAVKAMAPGIIRNGASNGGVRFRLRSGGTDTDTTSNIVSTASATIGSVLRETDPATSAAWTTSGLDGLEFGPIERSTNTTQVGELLIVVDYLAIGGGGGPGTPGPAVPALINGRVVIGDE